MTRRGAIEATVSIFSCRCYPHLKRKPSDLAEVCGACQRITVFEQIDLVPTLVHETLHLVAWARLKGEEATGLNFLLDRKTCWRKRMERLVTGSRLK